MLKETEGNVMLKEAEGNVMLKEAAWLSGQSWGFEYGRPGFKSPTRTTEWICPR